MTVMQLVFRNLEPALKDSQTLPPAELPRLLGDLEVVRITALARLSAPAPAQNPPDVLLSVKQAAEKLNCSTATLYKKEFPFVRRLGRKRLFSNNGIDDFLSQKR